MSDNLNLFNQLKEVPDSAKSEIKGGRMNGKTNICPMWRIQKLTETFGIVGFGWKVKTVKKWIEDSGNGEKIAIVDILLYVKMDGEWSDGIEGSGGSKLVETNKNGLYTNDEAFKMAYTDALGVACKMLGIGADVYFGKDDNKYDRPPQQQNQQQEVNKTLLKRVKKILYEVSGKDKERALLLLETLTTFNKGTQIIKGVKDFDKLSQKRLQILNAKLKDMYNAEYTRFKELETKTA